MRFGLIAAFVGLAACLPQNPDYGRMSALERAKATCQILSFMNRAATSFFNETQYNTDNTGRVLLLVLGKRIAYIKGRLLLDGIVAGTCMRVCAEQ